MFAIVALVVPATSAATKYVDRWIGTTPSSGTFGGQFNAPRDVGVSQFAGHVGWFYVVDSFNHRVQAFDAAGTFRFAIGRDVIRTSPGIDTDLGVVFEKCTTAADCKAGVTGPLGGEFSSPQGIAVNQTTGDIYVRDNANRRVQQFTADGAFVRTWGWAVDTALAGTGFEICSVPANCGQGSTGSGQGQFASTAGASVNHNAIAIHPSTGDVFVGNPGNRRIEAFEGDGTSPVTIGSSANFASGQPLFVAVDAVGVIYASDGGQGNPIDRFDLNANGGTGAFLSSIQVAALAGTTSNLTLGLEADPVSGRLFVTRGATGTPDQFSGVLEIASPGGTPTLADRHYGGLQLVSIGLGLNSATGELLLTSVTDGHRVFVADDDGAPAAIGAVQPASGVTEDSATLNATINSNSTTLATDYRVEVSRNGVVWIAAGSGRVPVGTSSQPVTATATALLPNTHYRVRVVTAKEFGSPEVESAELSFLTDAAPPDIRTTALHGASESAATVSARINPNATQTSYRVEWGTTSLTNLAPVPSGQLGAGSEFVYVTQGLSGLMPGTTYRYRFVAASAVGTTAGPTRTFTTAVAGQSATSERAFELVSAADKVGGVGVGSWGDTPGTLAGSGIAAYTGERFLVGGSYGSALETGSRWGFTNDWSAAERSGDSAGWVAHSPISHPNYQPVVAQFIALSGVTQDLSRLYMTGGNVTPALFPEMGSENGWRHFNAGYFLDWGSAAQPSRWELLGPAGLDQVSTNAPSDNIWTTAFAEDGLSIVAQSGLDESSPARSTVFGLAGPGDPTWPAHGDLVAGRSVYLGDTSVPADTFTGTGQRELVNVCTGSGAQRTELPGVGSGALLEARPCPAPLAGRDARLISDRGAVLSAPEDATYLGGTISADGSRVFFMSPDPRAAGVPAQCAGAGDTTSCPPQLYVRQKNTDGSVATRWISRPEPGLFGTQASSLTAAVRFEGATPDGKRVFFRTSSPLTVDDPNGLPSAPSGGVVTGSAAANSADLYMYEFPDDPAIDVGAGQLTRISAGPTGVGDCNSPLRENAFDETAAALRFASADGGRVYFVCSAPLSGVSGTPAGSITEPGGTPTTADQANVYLYDESRPLSERWSFVVRIPRDVGTGAGVSLNACASTGAIPMSPLGAQPGNLGEQIELHGNQGPGTNCFDGTADATYVTFFTMGRLTVDDPEGSPTGDIYGYDSAANELTRITAAQDGAGGGYPCGPGKAAPATWPTLPQCHGDGGVDESSGLLGFTVGGLVNAALGVVTNPSLQGDRTVFFQSKGQLVPDDFDDGYDVYQWRNGALTLVTSGAADSTDALYKGNDRTGRNVYFVTRDALTWQDTDDVADIYTARLGGGIPQPPPPAPCAVLANECQGGGARPITPSQIETTSLSGGGNVVSDKRKTLTIAGLSKKAKRRAARTGNFVVSVRTSKAGKVSAVAKGRIGKRTQRVASKSVRVRKAGVTRLKLRLSRAARQRLESGRNLNLSIQVRSPGARSRSMSVRLLGASS